MKRKTTIFDNWINLVSHVYPYLFIHDCLNMFKHVPMLKLEAGGNVSLATFLALVKKLSSY